MTDFSKTYALKVPRAGARGWMVVKRSFSVGVRLPAADGDPNFAYGMPGHTVIHLELRPRSLLVLGSREPLRPDPVPQRLHLAGVGLREDGPCGGGDRKDREPRRDVQPLRFVVADHVLEGGVRVVEQGGVQRGVVESAQYGVHPVDAPIGVALSAKARHLLKGFVPVGADFPVDPEYVEGFPGFDAIFHLDISFDR